MSNKDLSKSELEQTDAVLPLAEEKPQAPVELPAKAPAEIKVAAKEEKVAYADWFSTRLQSNKNLRAHHFPVILTYFKKNKLSETGSTSTYDQMLKKFGF